MAIHFKPPSGIKAEQSARVRRRREALTDEIAVTAAATSTGRNDLSPTLTFERVPIDRLRQPRRRVRKSDKLQVARVIDSIRQFGVVSPVLIDGDLGIVHGHVVVEAARALGIEALPCCQVQHLTEAEIRKLAIALNRLGETGQWEMAGLRVEVGDLALLDEPLIIPGFDAAELDLLLLDDEDAGEPPVPEPETSPPVSREGDLWVLGDHRLLCGNALDPGAYRQLLDGQQVAALFADPPYNIPIAGFVSGMGKVKHGDFAMGVGEMSDEAFTTFLRDMLIQGQAVMLDGAVAFTCMDWRHIDQLMEASREAGLGLYNLAVWTKGNAGMGALYRSGHELILVSINGKQPRLNNVGLGRHGRDRTNVWPYPSANQRGSSAAKALADHPTPKPVELVADALRDVTARGELVLDPFMGSGTTLIAAENTGRVAIGIELDPRYVDVAIRRWEALTGRQAVHADSGRRFADIRTERAGERVLPSVADDEDQPAHS